MLNHTNAHQQPIGFSVSDWKPAEQPSAEVMHGQYCDVVRLQPSVHGEDLYEAFVENSHAPDWTYLPYGPFTDRGKFDDWLQEISQREDPFFHAIVDRRSGKAAGLASFLRIDPVNGVIEIGHIHFSPLLQRSIAATEAMYLMMCRVFDELGYRRYEWKCDALNARSRKAAERLGFQFEGIFRQAVLYKGRNRDTAWYAIIDQDWSKIRSAYEIWLKADNFADGKQIRSLSV